MKKCGIHKHELNRYQEPGRALHKDVHGNPEEHHQIDRMPQAVLLQKVQSSWRKTIHCFQVDVNEFKYLFQKQSHCDKKSKE